MNNLNAAQEQLEDALIKNDVYRIANLQGFIKFKLGGYLNHSLFWENLTSIKNGGGQLPDVNSALVQEINKNWGNIENFKTFFNTRTAVDGDSQELINNQKNQDIQNFAIEKFHKIMVLHQSQDIRMRDLISQQIFGKSLIGKMQKTRYNQALK
ncbi:unnamed protein product [Paramecium sonneborni]|uniref:superoxide dismutase n=1 Tax=Paramecium sonneborni TaxID=65129 RepID=A0A8S1PYD4_9CILI|nr:unnamed protein product [Paramecium sonneborni]